MASLSAEDPGERGTDREGGHGKERWQTQRSEARSSEVEKARHRECVVPDAAMCEQVADVGDIGQVARSPEAIGEGCRDCDTKKRECCVGECDPTTRGFCFGFR